MKLYTFSDHVDIKIYPYHMLVNHNDFLSPTIKIGGNNYIKYIYPIKNFLYEYNSLDFLYKELLNNNILIDFVEFKNIILKLNSLKVIESFEINDILISPTKLSNVEINIVIVFSVNLSYINFLLEELHNKYNINLHIFYKCSNSIQSFIENNKNNLSLKIQFYNSTKDIFKTIDLSKKILFLDIHYRFDREDSYQISKYCLKNQISYFPIAIYETVAILGPFWTSIHSICLNCVYKNDIFKKLKKYDTVKINRFITSPTWLEILYSIIINEINKYLNTNISSFSNSILVVNGINYSSKYYNLVKFNECSQCLKHIL